VTGRGLRRHLDDLLTGRRPRPFRPTPSEADELRVAIELSAARPGADEPRAGFVDELHARLAAELDAAEVESATDASPGAAALALVPTPGDAGSEQPRFLGRRRLLVQGAGLAAASAAVGAAVGHALTGPEEAPDGSRTITPTDGVWQTVAATTELPEGAVRAFDLGAVAGFVHRVDGVVRAVSASCTHQGCRLALDAARNLDCPCHTTVFALSGDQIRHQLPVAPRPLPTFATREADGAVQVYAPRA
jgi:nitrite reductase/ring-hydroxylating ferredoxin subunit